MQALSTPPSQEKQPGTGLPEINLPCYHKPLSGKPETFNVFEEHQEEGNSPKSVAMTTMVRTLLGLNARP